MSKQTKHVLIAVGLSVLAYVIYAIYKTISAGISDVKSIALAPFTLAGDAYNAVTSTISNAVYNPDTPTPVTAAVGNLTAPLVDAGVTDDSAPDTQAQVTAFGNETADQKAAGVGSVSTWDAFWSSL